MEAIFHDPLEAWHGVCPSCLEAVRLVFLYEVNTGVSRVVALGTMDGRRKELHSKKECVE